MPTNNIMLEVTAKTDTGRVREANEDNFVVTQDCANSEWILPKEPYLNSEAGTILVVADGMGGLNAGEVASKIAIDSIKEDMVQLNEDIQGEKDIKRILINAVLNAHKKIVAGGKTDPDTEGMGSTIVIAWIKDFKIHVGWVGDSRCYVSRNKKLLQLSKDHSFVQSLVDSGELTKEQAFSHPQSNIITQSLGDDSHSPKPDYVAFSVDDNDIFLLCSDGLNSMVKDEKIEAIVAENKNLPELAEMLIQEANNEGGNDNITVLMAKVINSAGKNLQQEKKETEINDSIIKKHPEVIKLKKTNRFLLYTIVLVLLAGISFLGFSFLKKHTKASKNITSIIDKDKDGVPDSLDKCPDTPLGTKVDSLGCPITASNKNTISNPPVLTDSKKEGPSKKIITKTEENNVTSPKPVKDTSNKNTKLKKDSLVLIAPKSEIQNK